MKNIFNVVAPFATSVEDNVFEQTNIRYIYMPLLSEVGNDSFSYCYNLRVMIGNNLKKIGVRAFMQNHNLEKINVKNVDKLDNRVFYFSGLTTLDCDCTNSIENQAIDSNKQLERLNFENITEFDTYMLQLCNVKQIRMPKLQKLIGELPNHVQVTADSSEFLKNGKQVIKCLDPELRFNGLNQEIFQKLNTQIFEDVVCNKVLYCTQFNNQQLEGIRAVVLMNQQTIHERAFKDNSSLKLVYAPNTQTVGAQAFSNCSFLSRFYSNALRIIDDEAFKFCYALSKIDLSKATQIGHMSFFTCGSLTYANLNALQHPLPAYSFCHCASLRQVVAKNSDGWDQEAFASYLHVEIVDESVAERFQEVFIDGFRERKRMIKLVQNAKKMTKFVQKAAEWQYNRK